jgi:WhiB family redox-sensing transcriptional regulator
VPGHLENGECGVTSTSLLTLVIQADELAVPLPCSGNPRLWFSDLPQDLESAKASCQSCALRRACLAGAIERAKPWGVWGGEIFENGEIVARNRPRGRPAQERPGHGRG